MQLLCSDPSLPVGDLLEASNLETLALFDRSEMAVAAGTADGLIATDDPDRSVLVIKADDLAADVELLENLGATFFAGVTDRPDWGIRTAHLRDPDGNVIELYEDLSE